MDPITMLYQPHFPCHANSTVALDLGDLELMEEPLQRGRGDRFPPPISDWELSQLVDQCTSELCQLGAYQYGAYTG